MLLTDTLRTYKTQLQKFQLPLVLGTNEQGMIQLADLADLGHILITGQTGSGKSMFEHTIIYTLNLLKAKSVVFLLADMKQVEFGQYADFPNLYCPIPATPKELLLRLQELTAEKEQRFGNQINVSIVIIIDTISDVMAANGGEFEKLMKGLIGSSSHSHTHIICSDSRTSPDVFTPSLLALFPIRISFSTTQSTDSGIVLGSEFDTSNLHHPGDMVMSKASGGKVRSIVALQAPTMDEA